MRNDIEQRKEDDKPNKEKESLIGKKGVWD